MIKLVVLSCFLAAASAISPYYAGYVAPLAYSSPLLQPYNYRGPLSLAPGQPANILAADGRPLDTADVNADRLAHLTAKAFDGGFHVLKKRSAALIAPLAYSTAPLAYSTAPFAYHAAPLAYSAALVQPSNYRGPLSLAPGQPANILAADGRPLDTLDVNQDRAAHFTAKALNNGFHVLKKRSAVIAPLSYTAVAHAPLVARTYATAPIVATSLAHPVAYTAPLAHYW